MIFSIERQYDHRTEAKSVKGFTVMIVLSKTPVILGNVANYFSTSRHLGIMYFYCSNPSSPI